MYVIVAAYVNAAASSLCALLPALAGPIYVQIYNATLNILPGAFLFFTAGLHLINFILTV